MQSQIAEVIIKELPKFLSDDPDEKTYAIIVDDQLNTNEPLFIPLELKGITNYFPYRKTKESYSEDELIPHIDMKITAPVWDPYETSFAEQEDAMTNFRGEFISIKTIARGRRIINSLSTSKDHAVYFTDDDNFYKGLNYRINVAKVGVYKGRHGVTLESLSHNWFVSTEAASRTV